MKFFYITLTLIIFIISCKKNNAVTDNKNLVIEIKNAEIKKDKKSNLVVEEKTTKVNNEIIERNNKKTKNIFGLVGELKIPIDNETTFSCKNIQFIDKKNLLITMPDESRTLNFYDLKTATQLKKLKLEKEGPNGLGGDEISGFFYKNNDSIFIHSKFTFKINLVNINGKILNSFHIIDEYTPKLPVPMSTTFSPLLYDNGYIYMSGDYATKKKSGRYENTLIVYNLIENKTSFLVPVPKRYYKGSWNRIAALKYTYNKNSNTFILSHSISDSLIIKNNNSVKQVLAKSGFFNESNIQPFNVNNKNSTDYMVRAKYSIKTPRYIGILYDKYRKIYYRFAMLKNNFGAFNKGIFSNIAIMVFDKKFNKISEIKISLNNYDINMCFINNKGLQIANRKKYNENDNFLTFDTFLIK